MASRYGVTKTDIQGPAGGFSVPAGWSDEEVVTLIEEAEAWVDALTNDRWDELSWAFTFDGTGGVYLFYQQKTRLRCLAISGIQFRSSFDPTDNFDDDGETLATDSYIRHKRFVARVDVSESTRLVTEKGVWEKGHQNYKVTGTWGHSSVPWGIKHAVVLLCRETITPGSSRSEALLAEEAWADYRYKIQASATAAEKGVPVLSGYPAVDKILARYRNKAPILKMVRPEVVKETNRSQFTVVSTRRVDL